MWEVIYSGQDISDYSGVSEVGGLPSEAYNLLTDPEYGDTLSLFDIDNLLLEYSLSEYIGSRNVWDKWAFGKKGDYVVGQSPDNGIIILKREAKVAEISDETAFSLLKKIAPFVGISGALSFEVLKYLLGHEREELQKWLENQATVQKYDLYKTQWL